MKNLLNLEKRGETGAEGGAERGDLKIFRGGAGLPRKKFVRGLGRGDLKTLRGGTGRGEQKSSGARGGAGPRLLIPGSHLFFFTCVLSSIFMEFHFHIHIG